MTLFFYGPNTYLMRRQIDQMVVAFIKKTGSDLGLERVDGSMAKADEVRAALQATPFLSTSRLVIIDGLAANKVTFEKLGNPLELVPATTVAVFVEPAIDQRTTAFKLLGGANKVVKFEPQTSAQLTLWCKRLIEEAGGSAERGAVAELLKLAGEDQWRLSEEITKLINYAPQVTVEAVRALVVASAEVSIFDLVEAMTAGRTADAYEARASLARQKQDDIYVLSMIQWQLRNLLLAKVAPSGITLAELAKAAGMSPYVAGKMQSAANVHSREVLTAGLKLAIDYEHDIKSGRRSSDAAVEQLIYRVSVAAASSRFQRRTA